MTSPPRRAAGPVPSTPGLTGGSPRRPLGHEGGARRLTPLLSPALQRDRPGRAGGRPPAGGAEPGGRGGGHSPGPPRRRSRAGVAPRAEPGAAAGTAGRSLPGASGSDQRAPRGGQLSQAWQAREWVRTRAPGPARGPGRRDEHRGGVFRGHF